MQTSGSTVGTVATTEQSARSGRNSANTTSLNNLKTTLAATRAKQEAAADRLYRNTEQGACNTYLTGVQSANTAYLTSQKTAENTYKTASDAAEQTFDTSTITAYSTFNAEACRLTGLYYDALNLAQNGSGITSTFFSDGSSSIDFEVCFVAGTPILLADGTSKPIEKIQSGDMVLAVDHEHPNSSPKPSRVTRVFHNAPQATWKLTLADGQMIQCTKEHPFYVVGRGWTSAEDLGIGDYLIRPDGSRISLSTKEYAETVQPVFNIEVENAHTYFVGKTIETAVLVHNVCPLCNGTGKKTITVQRCYAYMFFSGMFSACGLAYTPQYSYSMEVDCGCGTIPDIDYTDPTAEYTYMQRQASQGTGETFGVVGEGLRVAADLNPIVSAMKVATKHDPTRVENNELSWGEWGIEAAGLCLPVLGKFDDLPKALKIAKKGNVLSHMDYEIRAGRVVKFLKAGTTYTSNGYEYITDELSRIQSVKGLLKLEDANRVQAAQKAVREAGVRGDHAGHLIARVFCGSGDIDNMVPMAGYSLNCSKWKVMENEWKCALKGGKSVKVEITLEYESLESARPTEFNVIYWIDGAEHIKKFPNQ